MKPIALLCSLSLLAIACSGGDDGNTPDAADAVGCPNAQNPANPGFFCPTATATAWTQDNGAYVEVGPANFDCLGTPSTDGPTNVAVAVTGSVNDFQEGTPVADATIEAFSGIDIDNPLITATADGNGDYALSLPAGETRVGFKVSAPDYLDTYLLNQIYEPDSADQSTSIDAVSVTTANLLPAIIGITRTPGLGVVAAAIRDCDGNTVQDVVATVSGTAGAADHLVGGQSYYFNSGLPTNHTVRQTTNSDGLFVVLELPETQTGYLQIWGFLPDQDPTSEDMTLLSELAAPVVGDTVITASSEPLRN